MIDHDIFVKCALRDIMESSATAFVDTVLITRHVIMILEFVNRDVSPDMKGKNAEKVCDTKVEVQQIRKKLGWKKYIERFMNLHLKRLYFFS